MSGLLSSLSAAARALEAQRYGLDVTGQNIANVNTAGYVRRVVDLETVPASGTADGIGGVDVAGVRAIRDRLLERRLQMERPAEHREAAIAQSLSSVEVVIGRAGASLDAQMDTFFQWASQLAADPTSTTTRHEFVAAGERLASAFSEMAGRLGTAQRNANDNVVGSIDEANSLLTQLAALNANIAKAGAAGATSAALVDRQKVLLDQLTTVLDVDVIERADGGVDITTSSGRALVLGTDAFTFGQTRVGPSGFTELTYDGQVISAEITGGTLGGYLHVRDTLMPAYLADLDTLASSIVDEVNALHTAGYDAAGNPGGVFFTVTAGQSSAATMRVSAAVSADPQKVAAAGAAVSGDNQTARALAALRDADVLGGGSFSDAWAKLVYRVGSDAQAAQQEMTSRQELVRQVEALYEAVSGVSLDEEAMTMMRFQRAYEANARFFQAIDQAIETLMNMV